MVRPSCPPFTIGADVLRMMLLGCTARVSPCCAVRGASAGVGQPTDLRPSSGGLLAGPHGGFLGRPTVPRPLTWQDEAWIQALEHGQGVESPGTVGVKHVGQ